MREPLLLPVCGLAAGIVAGRLAPFHVWDLAGAAALALLAAMLGRRGRRTAGAWVAALAFVPFGGWLADRTRPAANGEGIVAGAEQTVSGCVVRPLGGSPERPWFVLETGTGARIRVSVPAQHQARDAFRYGRRVRITAKVREPRGFRNPGSFDYAAYLAARGIHWQAALGAKAAVEPLEGDCGSAPAAALYWVRGAALARLDRLFSGDAYQRGMMKGLLLGDSAEIQRVWVENFRRTGTYHALVISGSHVSFVAGLFLLWRRFSRWGEAPLLALAALTAWGYALVAGADPPVLRSAAGFTLAAAAWFWRRQPRLLNIVAATALIFLLLDPWQLFEPSFQLSFLAVTAIAALAAPLLEGTSGRLHAALTRLSLPRRPARGLDDPVAPLVVELRLLIQTAALALRIKPGAAQRVVVWPLRGAALAWDLFLVSAAVQLALALPMALYFHRLSLTGLSANVAVTPVVTLAIPFGFLALALDAGWAAAAAGQLLRVSAWLADWHARWEPAWRIPDPPVWLAAAFAAALILTAVSLRQRRRWGWAAAGASAMALAAIVAHPFPARVQPGALELTAIDVGQGESLLLATPEGRILLVDTGGFPAWGGAAPRRLDTGEDVVGPYLWSRGIRRLDALALTHLHEDHAGGAAAILEHFRPAELWLGEEPRSPRGLTLLAGAARAGARIRVLRQGDAFAWGGARLETLAPPPPPGDAAGRKDEEGLILRVRHGNHSFLLTGDAEPRTERLLLDAGLLERADVLKVAHHGSRRSSRADFLDAVRPVFALISAGRDNVFGFPAPRVLQELESRAVMVLRTDLMGLVTIHSDGRRLTAEFPARESAALPRMEPF